MNTNLASLLSFLRGRRSLAISLTVSLVLGTALGLLAANALRASVAVRGAGTFPERIASMRAFPRRRLPPSRHIRALPRRGTPHAASSP